MSFYVTTGTHKVLLVDAEHAGVDTETLFFWNGEKTPENVVVTFNNRGGWLSFTPAE